MVTRLQQLYIGSHEEKLSAREHDFDRDFWAGSPSDRTSKLYRVHVKPRSSVFDPRLCDVSHSRLVWKSCHARLTCGRLGDADLGLSASYRTESVSRDCIPGMDDVSVMWSTLESKDGQGRHSGEDGADNRSTSSDTSLSRMCIKDATTTDGKQNGDILRMQSVSSVQ